MSQEILSMDGRKRTKATRTRLNVQKRSTRRPLPLALLIICAACAIRLWGIGWGLPEAYEEATPMHRAFAFWGKETGRFDFNPHFFNYPSFYFYIQFAVQGVYYILGALFGQFPSLAAFRLHLDQNTSAFVLLGRLTTMLFGVCTVFLVHLLGKRFFNEKAGLIGSFLLTFNLIHVVNSQHVSVDVPLTFCVVLSLLFIHSIYERTRFKDYALAGLCVGMGTGMKYTAALLIVPLLLAHFLSKKGSQRFHKRVIDPKIAIGVTAALCSFFIVSPFCFLDAQSFWRDFAVEMRHMSVGHFGHEESYIPYVSYLTGPLSEGGGMPLAVLALIGLTVSLVRHGRKGLLFLSFPVVYFAIVGRWSVQADRYVLPIVPFLSILSAYCLWWIFERVPLLRPKRSVLLSIATIGLVLPSTIGIVRLRAAQQRPDTRTLAKRWINSTIPQGSIIVLESQTPAMDRSRFTCVNIPIYTVTPELTAPFYDVRWYRGSQFIILSSYVYGRYEREQKKYPVQNRFYGALDSSFALMRTFDSRDGRGPVIKVYANENSESDASAGITSAAENLMRTPSLTLERKAAFVAELGSAYLARKETVRSALILLRTASQLLPHSQELHCHLATAYFLDGQTDESIAECDTALALDPNFPKAHLIRGIVLDETGRLEEAIDAYQQYVSLRPRDIVAYMRMGAALEKINRVDEARSVWERILMIDPHNSIAVSNVKRLEDVSP